MLLRGRSANRACPCDDDEGTALAAEIAVAELPPGTFLLGEFGEACGIWCGESCREATLAEPILPLTPLPGLVGVAKIFLTLDDPRLFFRLCGEPELCRRIAALDPEPFKVAPKLLLEGDPKLPNLLPGLVPIAVDRVGLGLATTDLMASSVLMVALLLVPLISCTSESKPRPEGDIGVLIANRLGPGLFAAEENDAARGDCANCGCNVMELDSWSPVRSSKIWSSCNGMGTSISPFSQRVLIYS